ncbi:MAG: bifunctional DNA-formamidopyrimidine glycosylase/DNA-(apurinic or apyrimidinic site) lyase [Shewanellaceae bacterium]|nr:bifunctional DNA-formamidopyrimidine glycosylase/DNA-(apurinic or apyrimidinic site) lyase [Shewanellaceae bacterium]
MPELPEVEVTRLGLLPHIVDQTIEKVNIYQHQLRWPVPSVIAELSGQTVRNVRRRGKYLLIDVASGSIMVHLGMSGHLQWTSVAAPRRKHDHIEVYFANQSSCLRYHDPRRFGSWLWLPKSNSSHPLLQHLAPEPLTPAFNATYLEKALANRKKSIKLCLMDNQLVVGVGNIYANEVLFACGIHPEKPAGLITPTACVKLVHHIKLILEQAIEQGGTTLKDFAQANGKPGYFKQDLHVYGRQDEPCSLCSRPLSFKKLGQRATVFCQDCQH